MIIQCNKCQKQYKVNPEKVTEKGTKITCPSCGHQFIVRRKAEAPPPEPKVKTPPCRVCGQPSTHVLPGDPPLVLCERCFQVEKEKKTRFSPEAFGPPPVKEEPPPPRKQEPPPPPAAAEPVEDAPFRKNVEGEYFDTFDEIPDLPSDADTLGPSSLTEATEAESKARPGAEQPEVPVQGPFAGSRTPMKRDEEDQASLSPRAAAPPASALSEFEAAEEDVPLQAPAPLPPPASPAGPVADLTAPRGRLSLEEEVERSLERETQEVGPTPAEMSVLRPLRIERRHGPAYLILGGVFLAILLAAAFWLLQSGGGEVATVKPPLPAVPAPAPSQPQAEIPPAAPAPTSLDAAKQKQLQEKFRLFREFFLRDTSEGYQKAIKELDQALALAPRQPEAEALKIETYAFMTSLNDNFLYRRTTAKLIEQASAEVQLQPASQRAKIQQFLTEKDARAGRKALETFLAENPEDGIGYYLLAVSYLQDQPPDDAAAQENLEKAISLEPELTRAYFTLAKVYQAQGQTKKALDAFRQVLELSPQKKEAGAALAKLEAGAQTKPPAPAPALAPTPATPETPTPAPASAPVPVTVGTVEAAKPETPTPAPATSGTVEAAKPETPAEQPIALPPHVTAAVKPEGGTSPTSSATGLAATGEAMADNLREIISEVSRPMSRVPAPAQPVQPQTQPQIPPEMIPPEERPSQ